MSLAIKPVEVKIPVPITLLTSTHVAVNPLIRRDLSGETVCLRGPSVTFLSNENSVISADGLSWCNPFQQDISSKRNSLFAIPDMYHQISPSPGSFPTFC